MRFFTALCHCISLPGPSLPLHLIALLGLTSPSPSWSTRLNAIASPRRSFLCYAIALQIMSVQCQRTSFALHYDSKPINAFAGPSRAKPFFCCADAVLLNTTQFSRRAMHFLCFSIRINAFAKRISSLPLLNYAVPSRISAPLLHSGSTPCHTTATPVLAMPSRLNALLSRRDTLRSHASPVPSYSLPRPCHAEQFPCVTLIRPAIAVHSYAMATHNHAITKQCLTLPPQFQADRIYAIAFLCLAMLCLCNSVLCLCNSVQSIASA